MLHTLVDHIQSSRPENCLEDVRKLASIDMGPSQTPSDYMFHLRTLTNRLGNITLEPLMPIFALIGLDHNRFGGIINRFTSGHPIVFNAGRNGIEDLMHVEAT